MNGGLKWLDLAASSSAARTARASTRTAGSAGSASTSRATLGLGELKWLAQHAVPGRSLIRGEDCEHLAVQFFTHLVGIRPLALAALSTLRRLRSVGFQDLMDLLSLLFGDA